MKLERSKSMDHREARKAASAFLLAVREGNGERLMAAAGWCDEALGAWRLAMKGVGRLTATDEIRTAFIYIWIERKFLPLTVGDRPIMAKAARVLFPGGYTGPPLRLYRGTSMHERSRRLYGFSWSTQRKVAGTFADRHSDAQARLEASQTCGWPTAILSAWCWRWWLSLTPSC
jgi:hypothetical protein